MRKFFNAVVIVNFFFCEQALSKVSQASCEVEFLKAENAKEISKGPVYEFFTGILKDFKRESIPHLYLVSDEGGAEYIVGSSFFGDKRGKILLGQNSIRDLGLGPALRGSLAHEVAHAVNDDGATGCDDMVMRDPRIEQAADALAAEKVGYAAVAAFLVRMRELVFGTVVSSVENDLDTRLRALHKE